MPKRCSPSAVSSRSVPLPNSVISGACIGKIPISPSNAGAMTHGVFNNATRGKSHSETIVYVRSRAGTLRETPRRLRRH